MKDELQGLSPAARARIEAMAAEARGAEAILAELEIPLEFSTERVDKIDGAIAILQERSAELKNEVEGLRQEKREIKAAVEMHLRARAYLHEMRPATPGDVILDVGTAEPGGGV